MSSIGKITFITGVFGSGKTSLALRMVADASAQAACLARAAQTSEERSAARSAALRYVDYDAAHKYEMNTHGDVMDFLASLRPGDVVDAIPFATPTGWECFLAWARERDDVRIIVAFCRYDEWDERVTGRPVKDGEAEWFRFWLDAFGRLPDPEWYDTGRCEGLCSRESAAARVDLRGALFLYIDEHIPRREGHDAGYQDIPEIVFHGYSNSAESWKTIHGLVNGGDWSGLRVVDAGCNHGFFSFRAREAGAEWVIGLDQSEVCLAVARCVQQLGRYDGVEFRQWDAFEPLPVCDVLLCLNALHHFDGQDAFMAEAAEAAPVAIYEVDTSYAEQLRSHYSKIEERPSHRSGRAIYRCER